MCGITGFLARSAESDVMRRTVLRMSDALRHRGPDDDGQWVDADVGITLGHRRLAILELLELGSQPMCSSCRRCCWCLTAHLSA